MDECPKALVEKAILRLHAAVSSISPMLEQGLGYGQANVLFAAGSFEK